MRVPISWLKEYVDIKLSPRELAEKLTMAGLEVTAIEEKGGEKIFEIEITSNRPDLLSITGVAREVAAVTGKRLRSPQSTVHSPQRRKKSQERINIKIDDRKGCARYVGIVLDGVKVAPSPEWMRKRLEAVGVRPVNNVVDITNYVLFELGQPLHAFDYDKLRAPYLSEANGAGRQKKIIVRRAQRGEELTTIDKEKRTLDEETLVIADAVAPVALAGIMGGFDTEVKEATSAIMLEAAWFDPVTIRRTSRKMSRSSESSYRFERNVDIGGVLRAAVRAAGLICEICGGEVSSLVDVGRTTDECEAKRSLPFGDGLVRSEAKPPRRGRTAAILLQQERLDKVLGTHLPLQKAKAILSRLGFGIRDPLGYRKINTALSVKVPSHRRQDITGEVDLIEEVARIWGYEKIPVSLPAGFSEKKERKSRSRIAEELIRESLVGCGLDEVITYSLISSQLLARAPIRERSSPTERAKMDSEAAVALSNPLSAEQALMRTSLLPGVLGATARNSNMKSHDLRLFEIGKVFYSAGVEASSTASFDKLRTSLTTGHPIEKTNLAIVMTGARRDNWQEKRADVDFFDLKGALEALFARLGIGDVEFRGFELAHFLQEASAEIFAHGRNVGFAGKVNEEILRAFDIPQDLFAAELDLDEVLKLFERGRAYKPLPKYPSIVRDVSIFVPDEIPSAHIVAAIKTSGGELIKNLRLFDQYCAVGTPEGKRGLAYSIEYQSLTRTLTDEEASAVHSEVCEALEEKLGAVLR